MISTFSGPGSLAMLQRELGGEHYFYKFGTDEMIHNDPC
jgi:hypothetical protein